MWIHRCEPGTNQIFVRESSVKWTVPLALCILNVRYSLRIYWHAASNERTAAWRIVQFSSHGPKKQCTRRYSQRNWMPTVFMKEIRINDTDEVQCTASLLIRLLSAQLATPRLTESRISCPSEELTVNAYNIFSGLDVYLPLRQQHYTHHTPIPLFIFFQFAL